MKKRKANNWLLGGFSTEPHRVNIPQRHVPSRESGHTFYRDASVGKEANKEMVTRHNKVRKDIKDERTRRSKVKKARTKVINTRKKGLRKVLKKNWKILWG
jgi:hypothetical protein